MKTVRYIEQLSNTGDFQKLFDLNSVVDGILKVLMIKKGSYIADPEVGSNIIDYVYNLSDEETLDELVEEVRSSLQQIEDITVEDLALQLSTDKKSVFITVVISTPEFSNKRITLVATNEYIYVLEVEGV